ncbi:MAG: translocation/assembly module TamB domain-containing protein [Bacteroidetes bacterium]|nr:translocation/assembly module TamB domain-containing protein [Bacteroidota bacterium]
MADEAIPKSKWKKRLKRTVIVFSVFLLLLIGFAYLVFRSPAVQTYLVNKVTNYLNKDHKSQISVEGVNVRLLDNALSLEGLLIMDYKKDTLLYLDEVAFDVDSFSLKKQIIDARLFDIDKGLLDVKIYKGDTITNLAFFLNEFVPKDTVQSKPWNISAGKLKLEDFEVRFNNENQVATNAGIDYAHIVLREVNAQFNYIKFDGDTLTTHLEKISAKDKSGFDLHQLSADIKNNASALQLKKLSLSFNNTSLAGNVVLKYNGYSDYTDFINKVKMNLDITKSNILLGDIGYFAPSLLNWKQQVFLKGNITGRVSNMKCKNLILQTGTSTLLNGNIEMEGLPDIDNTFIFADLKSLQTNYNDLLELTYPSDSGFAALSLPDMMKKLVAIKFKGEFTGFVKEFVAHGKLNSDLGSVITDVQFSVDKNKAQRLSGRVNMPGFQLGRLLGNESLGNIVLQGNTKLQFGKTTNANFDGNVYRFDFNGYSYSNIKLNAALNEKNFSGEVSVKDKYCDLDFSGDVNLAADSIAYHFKADVNKAYLSKLKLVDRDTSLFVSAKAEVNLQGNSLDELEGKASINDLRWKEGLFDEDLGRVIFKASHFNGSRKIDLSSSIADASVSGKFSIENAGELITMYFANFSNHLLPEQYVVKKGQNINVSVRVDNFKPIQRLFFPAFFLARNSEAVFIYNDRIGINLSLVSDSVAFPGVGVKKLTMEGFPGSDKDFKVHVAAATVSPASKIPFNNFNFLADLNNNQLSFLTDINNDAALKNNAHVAGVVNIASRDSFILNLNETHFYLDDHLWTINNDNTISWSKNEGEVKKLLLTMDDKTMVVSGKIGKDEKDVLDVSFNGISLEFLNLLVPSVRIAGQVTGEIQLSSALEKPRLNSSLIFRDLVVNKQKFGETKLTSNYLPDEEKVTLGLTVKRITGGEEGYLLSVAGDYFPFKEKEQLRCSADFKNFRITLLEPYFEGILSDIGKAKVYGTLDITGELTAPKVLGELRFKDFSPTIDYLNVSYDLNDKVTFKEDGIYLENFMMKGAAPYYRADKEEGVGYINGVITHNRFKDMFFNLEIKTKKLIALNTTLNNNVNYYGKAFVSGVVMVGGTASNVVMYANLTSEKFDRGYTADYTSIELPLDQESELPLYDFVEFVKEGDTTRSKKLVLDESMEVPWLDMTFDFKVTPDAKVKMIFDSRVGDEIEAQGSGDLQFQITSNGKFTMNGTYEVEKGEYFFTVKNIIAKKFSVSRGGTVTWTGDPLDAAIDLKALYKVRTKVSSLMDPIKYSQTQIDEMSSTVPVNVVMHLNGNLWNPTPTLDLEVNTTNSRAQEIVNDNIIGESEKTKQAISLLMQGSFIVPDNSKTAGSSVLNAGLSNAKQFLTGQVNNYLSQITGDAFNVGFDYNGAAADSLSNVSVTVDKRFLNDKVVVSGTFDLGKDAADMEVQYKLTQDVTLKAFRKSQQNQKDQDGSIPTQGAGVFFRKEFDSFADLFKKKEK